MWFDILATFKVFLTLSTPLMPVDMVVSVLELLEEPVGFEALPTSHIVDLESADKAIGQLLSGHVLH